MHRAYYGTKAQVLPKNQVVLDSSSRYLTLWTAVDARETLKG